MHKYIQIFEPPVARIDTAGLGVCFGVDINFTDMSGGSPSDPINGWIWDFGDGDTSLIQHPVKEYADTGSYNVKLIINTESGCSNVDSVFAYVNFAPSFSFIVENACINSPAKFIPDYDSTKITIVSWDWNFGDVTDSLNTSTLPQPTHIYDRIDLYTISMKMSAQGCPGESEETILIYPIPYSEFSLTSDYSGVQGRTKFTNQSIYADSYLWDFGNGNTSTVPDPIEVYEKDSTYFITLVSYNEYGCTDTSWKELLVFFKGLYFPTAFSPNNPNDEISRFEPKGINLQEFQVQVYDLRGNLVWESTELDENGSPAENWDGYYDGTLMPQGVYMWQASGLFRDGTSWQGQAFETSEFPKTNGVVTLIK
ncbi:MAG: PKD domain-containing protein, partial [Bacteroidales bacterium]|nr:PKD domain-containing protein [Bacteroidales bacterium]